jgi:hypothetical protein
MLSTNNLVFFIVHAQLRLRRLAAVLHFLDIVFPPPMRLLLVASMEAWPHTSRTWQQHHLEGHWSLTS